MRSAAERATGQSVPAGPAPWADRTVVMLFFVIQLITSVVPSP